MPSLRLLAVNAASLPMDLHGVARLIEELHPDVACVHGAPSLARWRSHCAALAREANLVVVGGGRTGGGNLLLSTLGVDVDATGDTAFSGHRGPRPPGVSVAALRLLGSPFVLGGARLIGSADTRARHTSELVAALDGIVATDLPDIVCVDDEQPGPALRAALGQRRADLPGGVFVDERITVVDADEIAGGGVRVDLELPG